MQVKMKGSPMLQLKQKNKKFSKKKKKMIKKYMDNIRKEDKTNDTIIQTWGIVSTQKS